MFSIALDLLHKYAAKKVIYQHMYMYISVLRAAFLRYFFNVSTGRCEQFTYGGCCGNENNFETIEECKQVCSGTYVCVVCVCVV